MDTAHSASDVRAAEAPLLAALAPLPDGTSTLMDRAAFGLATHVLRVLRAGRGRVPGACVVALVGPGDNGRDAVRALAHLGRRGVRGVVVDATLEPSPDALAVLDDADVVLDAVVGLGGHGGLRPAAAAWARAVSTARDARRRRAPAASRPGHGRGRGGSGPLVVVAVDLPSGVGVDDGTVVGPVLAADVTVTFGALKPCLLLPPAAHAAGRVSLVDIGLDLAAAAPAVRSLRPEDVAAEWPVPGSRSDKYRRGVLGTVAGGERFPGAAVLAVSAAVRAGVGMVRFVGPARLGAAVVAARPEALAATTTDAGRVQAWVLGCGVDPDDAEQAALVRSAFDHALREEHPVVLDAGALAVCADRLRHGVPATVVLTPHAGELAALLTQVGHGDEPTRGDVESRPVDNARAVHEATGATVLLKGAVTLVVGAPGPGAGPAAAVHAQGGAPAWLATAGSGDVLAGLLGALLAGRADDVRDEPALAGRLAAVAALVHARAADEASPGGPVAALAIADALPGTVARLLAASTSMTS